MSQTFRKNYLPYGMHSIDESDVLAVSNALNGKWITQGPKIAEFEKEFAKTIGSKHAIAVNSGTAALEIAVKAHGIGKGDEIITTPFTFVATANAALFSKANPVFADIEEKTFNISPREIEKKISKKTKAIIPMHFAGLPCAMDEIMEIAEKHNLVVIEDSCHALGAGFSGKKCGSIGNAGCFSFHPVKHITTGEGGMIATNDEKIAETSKMLRNHGIDKNTMSRFGAKADYAYDVKFLGRNFRITDFQCALGLNQLKKLPKFLKAREKIAKEYSENFEKMNGISLQEIPKNSKHAWHLYCILFEKTERDFAFDFLRKSNIGANVHYIPVYRHSLYRKLFKLNPKNFPATEKVFKKILSLPVFPAMQSADARYVVEKVKELEALKKY